MYRKTTAVVVTAHSMHMKATKKKKKEIECNAKDARHEENKNTQISLDQQIFYVFCLYRLLYIGIERRVSLKVTNVCSIAKGTHTYVTKRYK